MCDIKCSGVALLIMRSACFTSKRSVSPDAEVNTGTSAGSVESSKSPFS
uniref:Uncharacterized protein n=1 Tax=Arundo donax TaxID=35708 RepID=A0A0A9EXD6_ARUDO